MLARRHALALHLFVSDHQRVGDLHQLRVADLRAQLLRALVELEAQAARLQFREDLARPLHVPVRHGDDARLDRSQPDGEVAGEVLDEDGDEALEAPVDRAVDDDRSVLLVVLPHVSELEALGRIVVELDGSELPLAADAVLHGEVELRPVESAIAGVLHPVDTRLLDGGPQSGFRAIPHLVSADALRRPGPEFRAEAQAERVVHLLDQLREPLHLVGDLRLHQDDVRIVLLELPHAGEAGEHAGGLVPVQHVLRVVPDRQLPVAVLLHLVEEVVRGAVHRLERERRALVDVLLLRLRVEHQEHVLAVLAPVAAPLPEHLVEHERRLDLLVAVAQAEAAHRVRQGVEEQRSAVRPEHRSRCRGMEGEEIQLLAQLAVVALARLLLLFEPGVEVLLVEERRAVDPLELRIAVVSTPVGAGHVEQLDDADPARRRSVRPEAEVHPVAVRVERQRLRALAEDVLDDLLLERLAQLVEELQRLLSRDLLAHEGKVSLDLLVGGLLDLLQIFRRERLLAEEVVVEAVLRARAYGDLRARKEPLHHARHHVGGVVADQIEALALPARDHGQLPAAAERAGQVQLLVVELRVQRGLGQPGPDLRLHEVRDGRTCGHLLAGAVGERDLQRFGHDQPL